MTFARSRFALVAIMAGCNLVACTSLLGDFDIEPAGAPEEQDGATHDATVVDGASGDARSNDGSSVQDGALGDAGLDATPPFDAGHDATPPSDAGHDATPPSDAGLDATPPFDAGLDALPPADACAAGAVCSPGPSVCVLGRITCVSGSAVCSPTSNAAPGTACGGGNVCDNAGKCVAPCTTSSCPNGCCDPATIACVAFASQSAAGCGTGGYACHACAVAGGAPTCANGMCSATLIGSIGGGYIDPTFIDTDGNQVFYIDSSSSQVAEVSAHNIGNGEVLTPDGGIGALNGIAYVAGSPGYVAFASSPGTTTTVYRATPGAAKSSVPLGTTLSGALAQGGMATQFGASQPIVHVVVQSSSTLTPYNCKLDTLNCVAFPALTAASTNPASAKSPFMSGVTWPGPSSASVTVYPIYADGSNNDLLAYQGSGTQPYSVIAPGLNAPSSPTTDGQYVYWYTSKTPYQIQRRALASGSAVETLGSAGGTNQIGNLATDGKYVYWGGTDAATNTKYGIYYVPVTGGTPAMLVPITGSTLDPVVVHADNVNGQKVVYFGDFTNTTGGIFKVAAAP